MSESSHKVYLPPREFSPRYGAQYFTAKVIDYKLNLSDSCNVRSYIEYTIEVRNGFGKWIQNRRFAHFATLHAYMDKELGNFTPKLVIPALPPKTCFQTFDDKFVEERMKLLSIFLDDLLKVLNENKSSIKDALYIFLGFGDGKLGLQSTYRLSGEVLGIGGFGKVMRGCQLSTGEEVAIKIIDKRNMSSLEKTAVHREVEILQKCSHPNIIRLFAFEDLEHECSLVLEIVNGGELFDRIVMKHHYNEFEARQPILTLLHTIAYLHENGIVHRDLKPENILLCSQSDDARIKLADFGLSVIVKDLPNDQAVCGSPYYMAPEMIKMLATRNKPKVMYDSKIDIWSLGVVAYVLLVGALPFYDEAMQDLMQSIICGLKNFNPSVNLSTEASDFLQAMLTNDPAQRPTAKQLLEFPWLALPNEATQSTDLLKTLKNLKKMNAKRKFKAAVDAVITTNMMKKIMGGMGGDHNESK